MYKFIKHSLIVTALVAAVFLSVWFSNNYQIYYIIGTSMEPTIKKNSFLLVDVKSEAGYGDIIVIDFGDGEEKQSKRIIGLPNDVVTVSDYVYINGVKYKNSGCNFDICQYGEYVLNKNEYFVIGDNSIESKDSRFWGPITEDQILGVK